MGKKLFGNAKESETQPAVLSLPTTFSPLKEKAHDHVQALAHVHQGIVGIAGSSQTTV